MCWLALSRRTDDRRYLQRALLLAQRMTVDQAALAGGLVWEHDDVTCNTMGACYDVLAVLRAA